MSGLPTPHTAPPTSHGSTSPSAASSPNVRKERGAIAAQACDTCRSRKQRCDEQRPRCGTCQKFKLDCNYREPVPTKKDKTLTEILDRLKNLDDRLLGLENKVNSLGHSIGAMGQNQQAAPVASPAYSPPFQASNYAGAQVPPVVVPAFAASSLPYQFSGQLSDLRNRYIYVSSVHGMLSWPAIQRYFSSLQPKLPNIDLSAVEREGIAHMLGVVGPGGGIGWPTEHIPNDRNVELIASLTWEYVHNLSQAYFDSINMLNPILDRQSFMGDILPKVFGQGFQRSIESTITLFVLALGEVAMTSSSGNPIHIYNGRASGVKGGTRDCPPGMELFNEARSRIGFHLTDCSLENVQMFALASAYYGSCFYPMRFWRMIASASLACQAMIRGNPIELSSIRAELIRRAFWYCSIMETMVHLELGFPLMGLEELEHIVKAPQLLVSNDDVVSSEQDPFFLPQIALRRMIIDNDNKLKRRMTYVVPPGSPGNNNAEDQLTLQELIQKLAGELDEWRGMLPPYIRWQEDFPAAFPDSNQDPYTASLSIHPTPENTPISPMIPVPNMTSPIMFTTDLDAPPASYSYALDVQVAMLRSKYYYAKHVLYRPFLYKVLHYPEAATQDDAMGVAKLLRLCLKWPMAMSPTCKHKRLVPCLFFFTQNFFGILVLLHLSSEIPILREIRNNFCGERFEVEARETVELYLDWLRDLKEIDAGTAWHWEITKALYDLKE